MNILLPNRRRYFDGLYSRNWKYTLPSISRKWNWASFYSTLRKGWFCFWFSAVSVSTCKWIKGLISEIVEIKEAINCKVWAKVHVGCDSGKMISQLIASLWYGDRTIKEILWPAQWQMRIRVPCLFVSSVINGSKVEQLKKREKNERRIPRPSLLKHHPSIHSFVHLLPCQPNPQPPEVAAEVDKRAAK